MEELSDAEIFEISDFTNATPWESFIADIEKIFHQWELALTDSHTDLRSKQHRKTERVSYAGRKFVVSLEVSGGQGGNSMTLGDEKFKGWPPAVREMMESSSDFPPKAHHLTRWYGLNEFIMISPDEGVESLTSQAQAKLMLSSVSVAIANTGCSTPVFIQMHHRWRQMYVGVCEGEGGRVSFNMVHLRYTPPQFSHLTGLLEVFKSKIHSPLTQIEPVQIAIRYTYLLKHWNIEDWPVEPLSDLDREMDSDYLKALPIGAISDPIQEFHLSAMWPNLTEEMIVDRDTHSDLNPTHAPIWTVSLQMVDTPNCLLAEQLLNFLNICYKNESMTQLLGDNSDDDVIGTPNQTLSQALDRLTEPAATLSSPFFSSVVYSATQRLEFSPVGSQQSALPEREIKNILKCLFPVSFTEDSQSPTSSSNTDPAPDGGHYLRVKSAPDLSLTSLLANTLCIINNSYGLKAYAQVWYEVLQELRYRWENGVPIQLLPAGAPDTRSCLLHQKLQMLNCCIHHKLNHQQKLNTPNTQSLKSHSKTQVTSSERHTYSMTHSTEIEFRTPNSSISTQRTGQHKEANLHCQHSDGHNSSEDEFYEALETQDMSGSHSDWNQEWDFDDMKLESSSAKVASTQSEDGGMELENEQVSGIEVSDLGSTRVGALKKCNDLVLLATGEPLFVPITQEHTPMTEDMIWEQEKILSQLGTSKEAAAVRAKMQSSSLVSDMEAFKAANPGCLLEDFVRWYSPRDWIEQEDSNDDSCPTSEQDHDQETAGRESPLRIECEQLSDNNEPLSALTGTSDHCVAGHGTVETTDSVTGEGIDSVTGEGIDSVTGEGTDSVTGEGTDSVTVEGFNSVTGEASDGWEHDDWDVIGEDMNQSGVKNEQTTDEYTPRFARGHLSLRMQQPNNIWVESWNSAHPIPAYRQKRLFDDTREAEKVLHFLANLKPSEVALSLMPALLCSSVSALNTRQRKQPLASVDSLLQDITVLLSSIHQPSLDTLPKYKECIGLLSQAEHLLAAAHSIKTKLAQGLELIGEVAILQTLSKQPIHTQRSEFDVSTEMLLEGPELIINDPTSSVTGLALKGLLAAQVAMRDLEETLSQSYRERPKVNTDVFPKASGREFILRSFSPRPAPYSLISPHRMYCVLTKGEFRLAGAFGYDTNLN